jgi:hypothetical protein
MGRKLDKTPSLEEPSPAVTAHLAINIVWDELPIMLLQKTGKKKNKTKHP